MKTVLGLLAGLTLGVASTMPVAADFAITDLGTAGGTYTIATAIGDADQVAGWSAIAGDTAQHAFLWQRGTMSDLGTLGGTNSSAQGVNRVSQVVGWSQTAGDAATHAFLWQHGRLADLNNLVAADSGWLLVVATAINDAGQIVGWGLHHGQPRAFLWQRGVIADLGTLGGTSSSATAINSVGQVVGLSATVGDAAYHAFLWDNGTMTDLGTLNPDGGDSYALAINNFGQVVGASAAAVFVDDFGMTDGLHAFFWQNGQMSDLHGAFASYGIARESWPVGINDAGQIVGFSTDYMTYRPMLLPIDLNTVIPAQSGWWLDGATAINNAGQIVGSGSHDGKMRGFLLTPLK
jgi:probable HAF family extracellular repeat protein